MRTRKARCEGGGSVQGEDRLLASARGPMLASTPRPLRVLPPTRLERCRRKAKRGTISQLSLAVASGKKCNPTADLPPPIQRHGRRRLVCFVSRHVPRDAHKIANALSL